jgi:hypothetical protein
MADIQPSTLRMKSCFGSHYSLPYFQREYKWESRHFLEMINDIQSAFLLSFDREKGRKAVANYSPYFLGSIITASQMDAKKPLIDGQQRLTSMFVLIVFLQKYSKANKAESMDLSNYIGSMSFGQMDYTIEFSEARKNIFDTFLNDDLQFEDAISAISDLDDLTESDQRVSEALRSVLGSLDEIVVKNIAYFTDYVMERVLLIDISVDTESEGHRVFVTMNDRGLRLSPIDLLKGQILSRIHDPNDTRDCHSKWTDSFARLKAYDPEEDSLFIRTFLRAKWADSARGKAQGDAPGDFDLIGDAYHRWFDENLNRIGLDVADDFADFVREDIVKFSTIYMFIRESEATLTPGFESLHFNAIRRFGPQSMILISAIEKSDSTKTWKLKISLLSKLIDILLTARTMEGKKNTYDNIKVLAFALTREVRNRSLQELQEYVSGEWGKHFAAIDQFSKMEYRYADRSDLLFILARIACFIEEVSSENGESNFAAYWARDKGAKTFDIEHVLPVPFDSADVHSTDPFRDEADYASYRNRIGALILLPRSRNRSLQDKPYREKIGVYGTENVLAKTLSHSFYESNPKIRKFIDENNDIELTSAEEFGKPEIDARAEMYLAIAKRIWAAPEAVNAEA